MEHDGYRDELAVAHERIAQLEEQVGELLRANEASEPTSRLVTLRRQRSATVAQQAVLNSGVPTFAVFAIPAVVAGVVGLVIGAVALVLTVLFLFLSVRAFTVRRKELRAQRALIDQLDAEIGYAERTEMSPTRVRVGLAERDDGEAEAAYVERLRLLR